MSFFYDLNKRLANLGTEQKQISESVAKAQAEVKTPARITLEESLKQDMKALMEGAKPDFLDMDKDGNKKEPMKKAVGDKKKNPFAKKVSEDGTGGMSQSNTLESEKADKDYDKDGKVESPKAEYMGARIAAGKKAAAKMKEQISGDDDMVEAGLPDIADKGKKMAIARGDKPGVVKAGPLKNVGKGIKAFFKGEPEPMDEESEMIEFLKSKAGPQGHAESHPYNKSKGADAYNGMWGTGMDQDLDEEMTLEAVSRKHFQQVADLLKAIEDPAKRKEMAMHHAQIFTQQNPRFDIARFGQAAGVDLSECGMWESLKGGQHKLDVDGDGDIGADDLADLRSGNEVDEGFADMDRWLADREKQKGTGKFDSRKVSTGTVYTRKPETFAGDEEGSEPAVKRGRGRPAVAKGPERITKGAWKKKAMAEDGCCPHCGGPISKEGELDEEKVEAGKRHFFDKLAPAAKKAAKVVKAVTGGKKTEVDEESTGKEDKKAEKAGKKVAKDIEHDEGNKSKGDDKAEKAGKKVTKDIEADDKKDKKEKKADKKEGNPFAKKDDKEEKVEETTTSGSVATASPAGKSGSGVGKGIYDSWNRKYEELLAESVSVKEETTMAEHAEDGDAETMTITATGDDVARLRDVLAQLGVTQSGPAEEEPCGDDSCGTCGGVPCQCDELGAEVLGLPGDIEFEIDEADVTVAQNSPDYPTDQECSDDALQYAGGLNKPKSTGQTTIPVVASQLSRQVSNEGKESVDSFLTLYKAFKTK